MASVTIATPATSDRFNRTLRRIEPSRGENQVHALGQFAVSTTCDLDGVALSERFTDLQGNTCAIEPPETLNLPRSLTRAVLCAVSHLTAPETEPRPLG